MKKIFSILILAVATILSASATQVVKVVYSGTSKSITFRTNNVSATRIYYARSTNASPSFNYNVTPTNSGNYSTFSISSGTTNTTAQKTIQIQLDDAVTFFEISANQTNATSVTLSSATNLASVCLKGCSSLTSLTLGTMSNLSDIDVSNTNATVANAITAANCPNLENLNVANCGLTSLGYTGKGLYALDITGNSITTLNLSEYSKLDMLRCESNTMTSLTLPSSVTTVSAQSNNLTGVTGYGEPLAILDVASNNISSLTVSDALNLTDLDVSSNHLTFRSFPSATYKPARMRYTGNDGTYDLSGQMRAAYGSYSYPLMSMLPNYAARNEESYTLDLTDCRLDGNGEQSVVPVINSYNGTTDTPLTLSTSDVDGNDYAKSTDENYYGFMKQQNRVRFSFTDATYPGLTLYSNDFTVPNGVTGTIEIVDADGVVLYTKTNAVFSDATDGLPADARRDYTQYTYPERPTTAGQTWTVVAGPSNDAPFAWAKTYNTAEWYYLSLRSKYVTSGEQYYELGGGQTYNGHKLKDTYDSSDNNYYWAFVGNQYTGFKIYNKGRGNSETLQDYSGYWTPATGGFFPVMKSGESLTWIVRTNSSGTGFSLENKNGGTDNDNGGVSAPCFLNDFQGMGAMNYWITSVYDAQNDVGSLFNVVYASGALSATINWVFKDGNGNAVYSLIEDSETGATVSDYPTAVTSLIANRFVTLPALQSFTVASGENRKEITYTWTGPFQISTTSEEHHYNLKMRSTRYLSSDTNSDGVLSMPNTAPAVTDNAYRWMFFGDPFNGFTIRCYAKGSQELAAANGTATDGTSWPTFASEGQGTKWIVTSATRSGYTNPFSISPANTSGVYWNQYSYWLDNTLSYGLKYWTHDGNGDAGACVEAVELPDPSSVYITWNILDAAGITKASVVEAYNKNSTVSEYPASMTAYEDRFIEFPTLTSFTADRSKSVDVTYSWNGPFELTTDIDNPHLYYFKSTRYAYYTYAPEEIGTTAKQSSQTKNVITPRGRWFFTGNPFDGIEIRPYTHKNAGLQNWTVSETPTHYIPAKAGFTTDYWNRDLPSASIGFKVPGVDESLRSSCLSENGVMWSAANITDDKGCSFVVEDASDISMLVGTGYYRVRCMGSGLTSKYWKLDEQGGIKKLWSNGDPTDMSSVFRVEEQINASNGLPTSYYIAGFYNGEPWYLDNTRTSYSQQFTATQTAEDYMPAEIIYNGKSEDTAFFALKLSNQESYTGYSYANTNASVTTVVTWLYASGTADGSAWTFESVELPSRAIENTYYTTAYLPFDYTLPEGVTAYTITISGTGAAVPHELTGGVPAGTGVLLVGDGISDMPIEYKDYSLTSDDESNVTGNALRGTYVDMATPANTYVFSGKNGKPGFYKYSGATLSAYKAYLPSTNSNARGFELNFDDDGNLTGITVIEEEGGDTSNGAIFDLQGRRVAQPQKGGIYIINGKKVYVK